ncbi:MAG: hypothetical protein AAF074_12520 [Pseudomonadota bacterium]
MHETLTIARETGQLYWLAAALLVYVSWVALPGLTLWAAPRLRHVLGMTRRSLAWTGLWALMLTLLVGATTQLVTHDAIISSLRMISAVCVGDSALCET